MDLHDDRYNWLTAILQHIYQKLNFTIQKNDDEIKHSQAQMKVDLSEMKDKITGMERKQDRTMVFLDYL
jgi:hypothetical protein